MFLLVCYVSISVIILLHTYIVVFITKWHCYLHSSWATLVYKMNFLFPAVVLFGVKMFLFFSTLHYVSNILY